MYIGGASIDPTEGALMMDGKIDQGIRKMLLLCFIKLMLEKFVQAVDLSEESETMVIS